MSTLGTLQVSTPHLIRHPAKAGAHPKSLESQVRPRFRGVADPRYKPLLIAAQGDGKERERHQQSGGVDEAGEHHKKSLNPVA